MMDAGINTNKPKPVSIEPMDMEFFVPILFIITLAGYDIRKKARKDKEVPKAISVLESWNVSWKKVAKTLNKFQIKPHIKKSVNTRIRGYTESLLNCVLFISQKFGFCMIWLWVDSK